MKTPNSTLELGNAIESLVASYMESVRSAAQQALERALAKPAVPKRQSSPVTRQSTATSRSSVARRTPEELAKLCQALVEQVGSQPGVSMAELAEQLGTTTRSLERPMAQLKAAGRVRRVGQRNLTRYYPAVVRAADSQA
jgi:DNA-binding NtrC family response regulator